MGFIFVIQSKKLKKLFEIPRKEKEMKQKEKKNDVENEKKKKKN